MTSWQIIEGDALERLRELPAGSVQTCVTSPPYFGLRDYGDPGQLGLEPTPDLYVARLVEVFREVRRVLRDNGTLWLNLGDSYAAGGGSCAQRLDELGERLGTGGGHKHSAQLSGRAPTPTNCKPKDLLGIPWMVAFALRADGWYLRSDIIWAKPNPMPESVTDRPTKAHEYLFLLSKGPRYFYDVDAIREAHGTEWIGRAPTADLKFNGDRGDGGGRAVSGDLAGRNKRSVWTVATQPFPGAHFAVFPPKLIEPCVLAGSAEQACGVCGAPWERVVERIGVRERHAANGDAHVVGKDGALREQGARNDDLNFSNSHNMPRTPEIKTIGWQPTCAHHDDTGTSVVLDPFAGAGTTGVVAIRHGRSFIGIELNPAYAEMARERIRDDAPLMNYLSEVAA